MGTPGDNYFHKMGGELLCAHGISRESFFSLDG